MPIAIHNGVIYSAATSKTLREAVPMAKMLFDSPRDLFISAYPNTICEFFRIFMPDLLKKASANILYRNSPEEWFHFLEKNANQRLKDIADKKQINCFTFLNKQGSIKSGQGLSEKMERSMNDIVENISKPKRMRKNYDKSKKIFRLLTINPRRAGTSGHKSWELIEDGMTISAFLEKGGRMCDLLWEIGKNRIELKA